jgi:hypothetical protein
MVWPPVSRYLPYLLFACAHSALSTPSLAQSSPVAQSPKTHFYRLEVQSAEYIPEKDAIEYKLVNHGTSAVTAYDVSELVLVDGKEINRNNHGLDMLDPELFQECRAVAGDSSTDNGAPGTDNSAVFAIQPGAVLEQSIPLSDKGKLNGAVPGVRVSVTGIIWADGKIEGNPDDGPGGIWEMNRFRETRAREAAAEEKVLATVNAHPEDTDIQHRISEAVAGLQALADSYPQGERTETKQGPVFWGGPPQVIAQAIGNLKIAALSPAPKEIFDFFSSLWTCEHERRVAMLGQSATVAKSAR